MTSQIFDMTLSSKFFWHCFVSLVLKSFMSISSLVLGLWQFSFIRDLTRNLEFGNTFVWVLPNMWSLRQVGNTKFGTNVSNKILLNATKCQGYSCYRFWAIKGKPREHWSTWVTRALEGLLGHSGTQVLGHLRHSSHFI